MISSQKFLAVVYAHFSRSEQDHHPPLLLLLLPPPPARMSIVPWRRLERDRILSDRTTFLLRLVSPPIRPPMSQPPVSPERAQHPHPAFRSPI